MRAVKHLVPLVLAAALLVGCKDPRAVVATATARASATATASPTPSVTPAVPALVTTATPLMTTTPRPTPTLPLPLGTPTTGVASVDQIVAAVQRGDAAALEPYFAGRIQPCGCPADCSDDVRLDSMAKRMEFAKYATADGAPQRLRAVYRETFPFPNTPPGGSTVAYHLVFSVDSARDPSGWILGVSDAQIFTVVKWRGARCAERPGVLLFSSGQ